MSARTRFWIILGVAVVLAVIAWMLALPRLVQTNESLAGELGEVREKVVEATPTAVGGPSLAARAAAQLRTEGAVKEAVEADEIHPFRYDSYLRIIESLDK